jgi:hypothetical protein
MLAQQRRRGMLAQQMPAAPAAPQQPKGTISLAGLAVDGDPGEVVQRALAQLGMSRPCKGCNSVGR